MQELQKMSEKKILEKDIQREICEWLEKRSFLFWRSNNIPVFGTNNAGRKQFRSLPKYTPKGLPDIMLVVRGKLVGIEVKCTTKQSEDQKIFQDRLELAGGIYILAFSLVDVTNFLDDIGIY
jgi:hypothetical protein